MIATLQRRHALLAVNRTRTDKLRTTDFQSAFILISAPCTTSGCRKGIAPKAQPQEARATVEGGVVWPSRVALNAIMALQADLNPKLIDLARDLSGGAMIMLPSSSLDYENPDTAADLERYVASPGYPSQKRVALLKLAWDLIGSEFAGRHQQYEKFYGGPAIVNKLHVYRNYDFAGAKEFAEAALWSNDDAAALHNS